MGEQVTAELSSPQLIMALRGKLIRRQILTTSISYQTVMAHVLQQPFTGKQALVHRLITAQHGPINLSVRAE